MPRFFITAGARRDLASIKVFLRAQSPEAAARVSATIRAELARLSQHPHIGHELPSVIPARVRFWPVYSYLVAYDPESQPLRIIRVLHGARDLKRGFGGPG
jgi:plasmid stabilization system protein ParE